jgi:hypothetical protein
MAPRRYRRRTGAAGRAGGPGDRGGKDEADQGDQTGTGAHGAPPNWPCPAVHRLGTAQLHTRLSTWIGISSGGGERWTTDEAVGGSNGVPTPQPPRVRLHPRWPDRAASGLDAQQCATWATWIRGLSPEQRTVNPPMAPARYNFLYSSSRPALRAAFGRPPARQPHDGHRGAGSPSRQVIPHAIRHPPVLPAPSGTCQTHRTRWPSARPWRWP